MSRRPAGTPPDERDDESFIGRWSRRKQAAGHGETPEESRDVGNSPSAIDDAADDARPAEEPVLTDADMPDIDTIGDTSSVAEFFSPGVSEALRRKALRKLFHSPKFNVRDGLDDFDDDYTHFEKLGDIVTADMKHRAELEAERLRERALAAIDEAAPDTADDASDDADDTSPGAGEAPSASADDEPGDADDHDDTTDRTS